MSKKTLILILLLFVVIAAAAKKSRAPGASEWQGLTESEARSKLDAKLPDRIPADKRGAISDKVVGKMRARGVLVEDAGDAEVADEASGLEDTADLAAS